jgi:hypothetical protein
MCHGDYLAKPDRPLRTADGVSGIVLSTGTMHLCFVLVAHLLNSCFAIIVDKQYKIIKMSKVHTRCYICKENKYTFAYFRKL